MTETLLPDIALIRTIARLREIADALEGGQTMTDLAHKYGISIRVLRRLAVFRPRSAAGRPRAVGQALLTRAIRRIREGASYREISAELRVNLSTLKKSLERKGMPARTIKANAIKDAVGLYHQGATLSRITEKTGIPATTLYRHLRGSGHEPKRIDYPETQKSLAAEQVERLRQAAKLHADGIKLDEIEARTGLNRTMIYAYMRRTGGFTPRRKS